MKCIHTNRILCLCQCVDVIIFYFGPTFLHINFEVSTIKDYSLILHNALESFIHMAYLRRTLLIVIHMRILYDNIEKHDTKMTEIAPWALAHIS
jgi:hypothetical protein